MTVRRLPWGCALASAALILSTPASIAKPEEKPAKQAAAKPAATTTRPADKTKTSATKASATKNAAAAKSAAAPKTAPVKGVPIPRPRPGNTFAVASVAPKTASLAPTVILPTASFMPAPAATTPAAAAQVAPSVQPTYAPAVPPTRTASLPSASFVPAATTATPAADVALVKQAVEHVRNGRTGEALALQKTIGDPLARKLVEWIILRSDDHEASFERFAAFVSTNPSWPSVGMMRRRAEGSLWDEKRDTATVLSFFDDSKPSSTKGRLALARALLSRGDRAGAAVHVREAWRNDPLSRDFEKQIEEAFPEILTRADFKARMERRFYADDDEAAMRMAQRLGGADLAIARAHHAVNEKASNAQSLLEAVPASARHDAGYIFARAQWLRRQDKISEAAHVMLSAPRDPALLHNLDEWWVERRLIARKLLDIGEPQLAYRVSREAVAPPKDNFRAEHEFTCGWIALRFNNNPGAAYQHFSRIGQGTSNPITLARGEYWQGRAAEAAGRTGEARSHYQAAAHYPTAYYGQIARARLGLGEFNLRRPPELSNRSAMMNLEIVRAARLLYEIDARDLVLPFATDLAERAVDIGGLVALAEVARKYDDARTMLYIGKAALNRGHAFDVYAFPTNGMPDFRMVGPAVDRSVVYSIARQESAFNPRARSSANALGLMQVLPGTGKLIAKKFGFPFDQKRMLSDPAYNAQMGAAELGDALEIYRGSYILTFASYNAGRGRVREWLERYGDPRDPGVDPIDWVERIPFSETRNYVQRVIENMQVYRAQLGSSRLMIEADLRRGSAAN